jgi:hypothetical protein
MVTYNLHSYHHNEIFLPHLRLYLSAIFLLFYLGAAPEQTNFTGDLQTSLTVSKLELQNNMCCDVLTNNDVLQTTQNPKYLRTKFYNISTDL